LPIFEYQCSECKTKFEILHKSINKVETVNCPNCNSINNKKLLSTFSAATNSSSNYSASPCLSSNCGVDYSGGCSNGMCGLN
jgi:putative FmdB family regulatory protein